MFVATSEPGGDLFVERRGMVDASGQTLSPRIDSSLQPY